MAVLNTCELDENDEPFQYLPLDCCNTATPTLVTPTGSEAVPQTPTVEHPAVQPAAL